MEESKTYQKFPLMISCISLLMSFVALLFSVFLFFNSKVADSPESIFQKHLRSVVELHSSNDGGKESFGTATIVDGDGTLFSNAHLVLYKESEIYKEYSSVEGRFCDENEYRPLSLISYDSDMDTCILKFEIVPDDLIPFEISETALQTGQTVYAIGNALNQGISMTEEIVSLPEIQILSEGIERTFTQCNLTINDGNSGGALLNSEGQLIGITTLRLRDDAGQTIQGLAYCLPVHYFM